MSIAPAVLTLVLGGAAGCGRSSAGDAPGRRSESIVVADAMAAAPSSPSAATVGASSAHASAGAPARKLCEGELSRAPRRLPQGRFTPVAAAGAERPGKTLASRPGRWTWINFFAAWCGPCREEMPRLRAFQQKLSSHLDVAFVSLDDDERQLDKFLTDQPAAGVRAALWLEPKPRKAWLAALDAKDPPDLPAHVLVDRAGKVRCIVEGAVAESDFPAVKAIVER